MNPGKGGTDDKGSDKKRKTSTQATLLDLSLNKKPKDGDTAVVGALKRKQQGDGMDSSKPRLQIKGAAPPPDAASKKKLKIRLKDTSAAALQQSTADAAAALGRTQLPLLLTAVECIYQSRPVGTSLEQLYRAVEELCAHGMADTLYARLEAVMEAHTQQLYGELSRDAGGGGDAFLARVEAVWGRHCDDTKMIRQVVLHMDRSYTLRASAAGGAVRGVWDLGLFLFAKHVAVRPDVCERCIDGLLGAIERERNGESVARSTVHALLRMLLALQLYTPLFEERFLAATRAYYAADTDRAFAELPMGAFLRHLAERLRQESDRVLAYLDDATRRPLMQVMDATLLSPARLEALLDKGLDALLEAESVPELVTLYALCARVQGLALLGRALGSYVRRVGVELVADKARDATMVEDVLRLKASLDMLVARAFAGNKDFGDCVRAAFEHFINSRSNKPAELMAKYVDTQLKSAKLRDEEVDELLNRVMILFRFINGKDFFEAFYKKDLAKRLLLGRSASMEWERMMISKLKAECGSPFTQKLEGMFKDLELSNAMMGEFTRARGAACPVALQLHVLTGSYWPAYAPARVVLPPELDATRRLFESFYADTTHNRVLTWQHSLSYCNVNAHYPDGSKKMFHVSLFQAVVLLQFNDADALTYGELAERTGIERDELGRTLKSLCMGKVRVIVRGKADDAQHIGAADTFRWKSDFKHKMIRIKINTIQVQETVEEDDAVREAVLRDRQYQIDATIVRVMKMRRVLTHSLLVAELFAKLKFPVKPADIKKRIESLIEREYLERDPANNMSYLYKA